MAEFTNVAAQTVAAKGNVVFSNTAVKGSNCIQHREGSGIITLRGLTNQCKARFFVDFSEVPKNPFSCTQINHTGSSAENSVSPG